MDRAWHTALHCACHRRPTLSRQLRLLVRHLRLLRLHQTRLLADLLLHLYRRSEYEFRELGCELALRRRSAPRSAMATGVLPGRVQACMDPDASMCPG